MAMTVVNNSSATMALGELNKNVTSLGKQLKKVATGTKITGAGDSAAEYTISERMRVRQRALEQDAANVQTGRSMLKVAEGAIQEQLEIMKTIKAKVIDANNDSNTDLDRLTIQKEISQGFEQVHDIAYEATYNGKLLLVGNKQVDEIYTWRILDKPETVPESDSLNFIEDQHDTLDDQVGPFATLPFYSTSEIAAEPLLGSETSTKVWETGDPEANKGTKGYYNNPQEPSAATFTIDFSTYNGTSAEGLGFRTTRGSTSYYDTYYVLTSDTSKNHRVGSGSSENVREIQISSSDSSAAIAQKVAAAIKNNGGVVGDTSVSGSTVTITTSYKGSSANSATVKGWSQAAGSAERTTGGGSSAQNGRSSATATGLGAMSATGTAPTAGKWIDPTYKDYTDPVTDITTKVVDVPGHYEGGAGGTKARIERDISSVPTGSGLAIAGSGGTAYVRFVDGSGITRDSTGVYEIGKDANISNQTLSTWNTYNANNSTSSYVQLSLSNGKLTLTSVNEGGTINVTDGFASVAAVPAVPATTITVDFAEVKAYNGTVTPASGGQNRGDYVWGNTASHDIDLTAYNVTDSDKLEEFISALKGKAISAPQDTVEFIDRKVATSFDAIAHLAGSSVVDLNTLRSAVAGGATIAEAFINLMTARRGYSDASDTTDPDNVTRVLKVSATYHSEEAGNNQTIRIYQGNMSAYTIDFKSYAENNGLSLPDALDGKGFRVYCATCADQWFNFQFKSKDDPSDADRPASGQSGADLKTMIVDISGVTDVKSLVEALYEQGGQALETIKDGHSHMLHFAADPEAGTLTVYDDRMFDLSSPAYRRFYPNLQEKGAKLADGVMDDVQKATRGVFVRDLIIHHTDKASMNIHVQIPQTSMDHLFNYIPGIADWTDYNVLTQANREKLLGNQAGRKSPDGSRMVKNDEPGLLDRAIQYLTDANTLVGAQTSRLEMTHDNIIIQQEATTSSESTIRDADMAKEMTEYTKSNVLTQAAQSMLAQANQNGSGVLSLLQ